MRKKLSEFSILCSVTKVVVYSLLNKHVATFTIVPYCQQIAEHSAPPQSIRGRIPHSVFRIPQSIFTHQRIASRPPVFVVCISKDLRNSIKAREFQVNQDSSDLPNKAVTKITEDLPMSAVILYLFIEFMCLSVCQYFCSRSPAVGRLKSLLRLTMQLL